MAAVLHNSRLELHFDLFSSELGRPKLEKHGFGLRNEYSFPISFFLDLAAESWSWPRPIAKSYGAHIWSNEKASLKFLGRGVTLGQCEIHKAYMTSQQIAFPCTYLWYTSSICPPVYLCLSCTATSCYPFSSKWWSRNPDRRVKRRSTLWLPKPQSGRPLLLRAEAIASTSTVWWLFLFLKRHGTVWFSYLHRSIWISLLD